jgi:hypothetical protein
VPPAYSTVVEGMPMALIGMVPMCSGTSVTPEGHEASEVPTSMVPQVVGSMVEPGVPLDMSKTVPSGKIIVVEAAGGGATWVLMSSA